MTTNYVMRWNREWIPPNTLRQIHVKLSKTLWKVVSVQPKKVNPRQSRCLREAWYVCRLDLTHRRLAFSPRGSTEDTARALPHKQPSFDIFKSVPRPFQCILSTRLFHSISKCPDCESGHQRRFCCRTQRNNNGIPTVIQYGRWPEWRPYRSSAWP